MVLDGFTIRTSRSEGSPFPSDRNFSLSVLFTPDPTLFIVGEELVLWLLLTLTLCLLYCAYARFVQKVKKMALRAAIVNTLLGRQLQRIVLRRGARPKRALLKEEADL